MPVEFTTIRDGTVAWAHCSGLLTEAEIVESIRIAFGTHIIGPGVDRLVTIDRDAEIHLLDIAALRNVQRLILEETVQGIGEPRFRSALVYASLSQKNLMELYKAIWDLLDLPGIEFFVVSSEDEAFEIFDAGRSGLQHQAG